MFPKKLENYAELWNKVSLYLIAPIEPDAENVSIEAEGRYVVYRRYALGCGPVAISKEFMNPIVQLMKDAGVEIRDKPINWEEENNIERLWNDRVHEFVIIEPGFPPRKYDIYHVQLQESLVLEDYMDYTWKDLDKLALKMIERGAKLVKKS